MHGELLRGIIPLQGATPELGGGFPRNQHNSAEARRGL